MRSLFLALLCAAPLAVGYSAGDAPTPEPAVQAEAVYLTSMGCDLPNCTDPTHFHHCLPGCTEAGHYHDCPVGCQEPLHGHGICNVDVESAGEVFYYPCMGCYDPACTDPSHYHHCPVGCTDPTHYHACPLGCQAAGHGHGACWTEGDGAGYGEASVFHPCMGCTDPNCTDPTHYHHCPMGCTDPAHYHDCPLNCQNPAHPHAGFHHSSGRGHHGGHRHH